MARRDGRTIGPEYIEEILFEDHEDTARAETGQFSADAEDLDYVNLTPTGRIEECSVKILGLLNKKMYADVLHELRIGDQGFLEFLDSAIRDSELAMDMLDDMNKLPSTDPLRERYEKFLEAYARFFSTILECIERRENDFKFLQRKGLPENLRQSSKVKLVQKFKVGFGSAPKRLTHLRKALAPMKASLSEQLKAAGIDVEQTDLFLTPVGPGTPTKDDERHPLWGTDDGECAAAADARSASFDARVRARRQPRRRLAWALGGTAFIAMTCAGVGTLVKNALQDTGATVSGSSTSSKLADLGTMMDTGDTGVGVDTGLMEGMDKMTTPQASEKTPQGNGTPAAPELSLLGQTTNEILQAYEAGQVPIEINLPVSLQAASHAALYAIPANVGNIRMDDPTALTAALRHVDAWGDGKIDGNFRASGWEFTVDAIHASEAHTIREAADAIASDVQIQKATNGNASLVASHFLKEMGAMTDAAVVHSVDGAEQVLDQAKGHVPDAVQVEISDPTSTPGHYKYEQVRTKHKRSRHAMYAHADSASSSEDYNPRASIYETSQLFDPTDCPDPNLVQAVATAEIKNAPVEKGHPFESIDPTKLQAAASFNFIDPAKVTAEPAKEKVYMREQEAQKKGWLGRTGEKITNGIKRVGGWFKKAAAWTSWRLG